jgi:hypothetical protein
MSLEMRARAEAPVAEAILPVRKVAASIHSQNWLPYRNPNLELFSASAGDNARHQ